MKILVVGGGGREHAIVKKLLQSPLAEKIYCAPGNGGIEAAGAKLVGIAAADVEGIVSFAADNAVDYAVVASDDPLVLGTVDALAERSIPAFGPKKAAAEIEGSKIFAKNLMKKYGIPTAAFEAFDDLDSCFEYLKTAAYPVFVKADGLALGKGAVFAGSFEDAAKTAAEMMSGGAFGASGRRVVIEECMEGHEVTVLAFCDGETLVPMVSAMDHKRAFDGDKGLNTGGMGVIAPNPFYTPEVAERCEREIFYPTMRALNAEGRQFRGCIYFEMMLTAAGPKVIEYNCRFGDPEAQALLPLLKTDLLAVMLAVTSGRLKDVAVEFEPGASCTVVMASAGYPGAYEKGREVDFGGFAEGRRVTLTHAGTRLENGRFFTSGGRVLAVTATADSLAAAVASAYENISKISFDGGFYRGDIGKKALEFIKTN